MSYQNYSVPQRTNATENRSMPSPEERTFMWYMSVSLTGAAVFLLVYHYVALFWVNHVSIPFIQVYAAIGANRGVWCW